MSSRPDDAVSYDPPSSVDADQRRAGLRALSENVETSPPPSPLTPLPMGEGNSGGLPSPIGRGTESEGMWKSLFRFALISSLIVNLAFIAMLISMSLYERFEKSAEREQKTIQAIEPNAETPQWGVSTQGVHAAPSSAPQP